MTHTARTEASEVGRGLPIDLAEFRRAMSLAELEDIIDELVETFLDDAPGRMGGIEAAVLSALAEETRLAAHAYKSSAANMYAKHLADLLAQLESAGMEGDTARATELLPEVQVAHDATVAQLKEQFK